MNIYIIRHIIKKHHFHFTNRSSAAQVTASLRPSSFLISLMSHATLIATRRVLSCSRAWAEACDEVTAERR